MGKDRYQKIEEAEQVLKEALSGLAFDCFDVVRLCIVGTEWQIFLASSGDPSQDFKYGEGESINEALMEAELHVEAEKEEMHQR